MPGRTTCCPLSALPVPLLPGGGCPFPAPNALLAAILVGVASLAGEPEYFCGELYGAGGVAEPLYRLPACRIMPPSMKKVRRRRHRRPDTRPEPLLFGDPVRFTAMTSFHTASGVFRNGILRSTPTLFTMTSRRPNSPTACWIKARTSSGLVTS